MKTKMKVNEARESKDEMKDMRGIRGILDKCKTILERSITQQKRDSLFKENYMLLRSLPATTPEYEILLDDFMEERERRA